jgi:hypothetical protein
MDKQYDPEEGLIRFVTRTPKYIRSTARYNVYLITFRILYFTLNCDKL